MRLLETLSFKEKVGRRVMCGIFLFGLSISFFSQTAFAIVGKAEKFNEFEEERLKEFHEQLLNEEQEIYNRKEREKKMDELLKEQQDLKKSKKTEDQEVAKAISGDLEKMKMDLLSLPKRDRFQFESKDTYHYNSNVAREMIGRENGDTSLETRDGVNIDLSGKKTDLRFTLDAGRKWNIERDENDIGEINESLNYRRKYFKKVYHSLQTKVGRQNSKTPEMNKDKVRWDFGGTTAYNFPVTSKLSTNSSWGYDRRIFPQLAFHKDASWEGTTFPSLFWNFTPKSRMSLGYQFGVNRILSKAGNTNDHSVHLGYFGQVTRKSSTSIDFSAGMQTPKSLEAPMTKTLTAGWGYIWQWTGKTQLTFQFIRSLQNTTSELKSGLAEGENETTKQDIYYTNDSFSISMNSRLTRKLSARSTVSITRYTNKTHQAGRYSTEVDLKDNETMQITYPFETNLSYEINRYATLNLGYTFAYRLADEKPDNYRVHEVDTSLRVVV